MTDLTQTVTVTVDTTVALALTEAMAVAVTVTSTSTPAVHVAVAVWLWRCADIDEGLLRSVFEPYGALYSVRVLVGKNCAFVHFTSPQHAEAAIAGLNGQMVWRCGDCGCGCDVAARHRIIVIKDDGEEELE